MFRKWLFWVLAIVLIANVSGCLGHLKKKIRKKVGVNAVPVEVVADSSRLRQD
jgi:hypothetical protein